MGLFWGCELEFGLFFLKFTQVIIFLKVRSLETDFKANISVAKIILDAHF